ncbi:redox-regulated ATPase YchF [candidate division WOR-3 bacterium]|nr:redox-regulated ATPase YchF [candidate division WOR-3 bacterium]
MRIGIVGLPNVGKSSLFNFLTRAGAAADSYPFTTIDANRGMTPLVDPFLKRLGEVLSPPKLTPAQIEVIDIAGLVKDAHKGEGLGNRFLGHIRDVDLIFHLIRGFEAQDIPHVFKTVDPARDKEVILTELALADLETVERRLAKQRKRIEALEEVELLDRYHDFLSSGSFSLNGSYSPEDISLLKSLGLLIPRSRIEVLNLSEEASGVELADAYRLSVSLEQGIEEFDSAEQEELRREAGVDAKGVDGLLERALEKLGLIRFYTVKGEEVRAWTIQAGSTALDAAARIHSDIARGFIKAEVVNAEDLLRAGSWKDAGTCGKLKVEGKDYVLNNADVLLVKFR